VVSGGVGTTYAVARIVFQFNNSEVWPWVSHFSKTVSMCMYFGTGGQC
jgi:hypothetical protein